MVSINIYLQNLDEEDDMDLANFLNRDNLVDNFSTHKEEVDRILAEGVKKLGINGR